MRHGSAGLLREDLVDLRALSAGTLQRVRRTPSAALGSSRTRVSDADLDRILEILRAWEIRYFLYIGGNGSTQTSLRLHRLAADRGYELHVVAVPKTIDNDLVETDHCPGHPSVARWLAMSVREAGLDTEAIGTADPVKVIETMGRDTGVSQLHPAAHRRVAADLREIAQCCSSENKVIARSVATKQSPSQQIASAFGLAMTRRPECRDLLGKGEHRPRACNALARGQ